jgi:hypothetical protein
MKDKHICSGWHYTFGWLRRPELDNDGYYCYEDGEGDQYYTDAPHHENGVYLDCWEDAISGERYLAFSPVPKGLQMPLIM